MNEKEIQINDQIKVKETFFKLLFFPATEYCSKITERIVNITVFIAGIVNN